jgi:hypothetical protein
VAVGAAKRSPPPSDPFVLCVLPHVVRGDDLNDPPECILLELVANTLHRIQGVRIRRGGAFRSFAKVGHVGRLEWRGRHLQGVQGLTHELRAGRLFDHLHGGAPLVERCLVKEDMAPRLQDLAHHPPQRNVRQRVLFRVLHVAAPDIYGGFGRKFMVVHPE